MMEEGWRACKRGRAGEIRPLLLCTHFAVMCCHAAGAGGGAADSSLLRRLGASHQLEACRLAAETGGRCWRESVLSLRGGLADFRSYKPSKYDSDKEDDEDPILPPQLEEEARPWELEPDQKEDKLEDSSGLVERRDAYEFQVEQNNNLIFNSTMPGGESLFSREAYAAVADMVERGDERGVAMELKRQLNSRVSNFHLFDPLHDPSNPRPGPKTLMDVAERLIEMEIAIANPLGVEARGERMKDHAFEKATSLGISPVEVESSEGEALDNLDGGELFEPEKILNQDSEEDYLNYTQTLEESLAEIGVYTIPVANETDFVRAEAETEPTAANAWDAWDMVKCKDQSGFDMLCLRHVRWGTEIEFSITSTGGAVFVKPDAKHGTLELFADGSWEDFAPGVIEFECEFVFEWLRNNTGCGWLEAMGGADGYMMEGRAPYVPVDHLERVDRGLLQTNAGWVPAIDRWSDKDRFDTAYKRTYSVDFDPEVFDVPAVGPQQGHWTAREEGAGSRGEGKIVWSNDECLCEMVLTTEGMYFIGSDARFLYRMKPQSVRVEYGLAGCNEGMSTLFKLSNVHARARLGFPGPSEVRGEGAVVDALRNWTAVNGWHRLRERLFDQGRNCHESLIDLQRDVSRMERLKEWTTFVDLDIDEGEELYHYMVEDFSMRVCRLDGFDENDYPLRAVDVESGKVIWEKDQPKKYSNIWARDGLEFKDAGHRKRLFLRETGALVAEWTEAGGGGGAVPMDESP